MSTEQQARPDPASALGLSEQALREALEQELLQAMRVEGSPPTVHAIAHSVARILADDHLRIAEQLRSAGVRLDDVD